MKSHLLSLLLLLAATLLPAQTPAPVSADPTEPDESVRRLLMASGSQTKPSQVPSILLRGRILPRSGPGFILIEIDKQIFTLKQDSSLSLPGAHSQISLRLAELTREAATIEVQPFKQTIRLQ